MNSIKDLESKIKLMIGGRYAVVHIKTSNSSVIFSFNNPYVRIENDNIVIGEIGEDLMGEIMVTVNNNMDIKINESRNFLSIVYGDGEKIKINAN